MNSKSFREWMTLEGMPEVAISNFLYYYDRLEKGDTGFYTEKMLNPVHDLPRSEDLKSEHRELGEKGFAQSVMIKLNGGLGTSMGLTQAKSLLPVKKGLCFLDILARQSMALKIPLLLMNSFVTRTDTLDFLSSYGDLESSFGLDFLQHKVPKVRQDNLLPITWEKEPNLAWCPPGHGDIYIALVSSGILKKLIDGGVRYAFLSNADNLGATPDSLILGYLIKNEIPFLMEAVRRTEADKKGGHLALREDGQLILRERAQCPGNEIDAFEDIERYQYFNSNNLWIDLLALEKKLSLHNGILELPMIRNSKHVDPRDSSSPLVYQLETAMGSAISVFEGARAIEVSRQRLIPVKTTNDLLLVRSSLYELDEMHCLIPSRGLLERTAPIVSLDPKYYRMIDAFEAHFPFGVPDLTKCNSLTVQGDFIFGRDVECRGNVFLESKKEQKRILDQEILD